MAKSSAVRLKEAGSEEIEGQATFDLANLRLERTGLPFVVFISQRGGARHDVRIKLARSARCALQRC